MFKRLKSFFSNSWEAATDGQKGSVIDVIKIFISCVKLFWNAVSSQLNAIMSNNNNEKETDRQ